MSLKFGLNWKEYGKNRMQDFILIMSAYNKLSKYANNKINIRDNRKRCR